MASVNQVILVGNLGADPDIRFTQAGKAVGEFRIATSYKPGENEETEWHRIVVWDKLAELAGKYLTKGKSVYVQGRIKTRNYEDKDGVTKYITEVVAERLQFLSPRADNQLEPAEDAPAPKSAAKKPGRKPRVVEPEETADGEDDPFAA